MEHTSILLVEDEPDLRLIYRGVLEREGYHVVEAADGSEALQWLLRPDGDRFRLVVSDVKMPKLGGRDLLWRTAELFPDLPMVLLSGMVPEDCVYTGIDRRARAYLPKPLEPRDLVNTVRSLLPREE